MKLLNVIFNYEMIKKIWLARQQFSQHIFKFTEFLLLVFSLRVCV